MQSDRDSVLRNKEHYESLYSHTQLESVVKRARDARAFLEDAIPTDASWHGLYHGSFQDRLPGTKVLELGAGDGLNALVMASLGANVVALDIADASARLIRAAASRLGLDRVEAVGGDFLSLAFDARSFDFVIGKAFLHHLTHDLESSYLSRVATLLKPEGEARFVEPATNSRALDMIRWVIPVPGRPSVLSKTAFAKWKHEDPHPQRDNSSKHFAEVGSRYFHRTDIVCFGSIERLYRLLPQGRLNRRFRRWAHRVEDRLPLWFRIKAARFQLIVYSRPRS